MEDMRGFTVSEDMAQVMNMLPEEQQGAFARAIIRYGIFEELPDESEPWFIAFYGFIYRIDRSIAYRSSGKNGAKSKAASRVKKVAKKGAKTMATKVAENGFIDSLQDSYTAS